MKPKFVVVDFETKYGGDLGFAKQKTEGYVRDPRFQIIGVGVKIENQPATWRSFRTNAEYAHYLRNLKDHYIICHNTRFDGAILSWLLGIRPKMWFDTLSMARPITGVSVGGSLDALSEHFGLGVKGKEVVKAINKGLDDFTEEELAAYGEYCKNDCELTWRLFQKLLPHIPKAELRIIDMMLRMFTEPMIELDTALLTRHLSTVQQRKEDLLAKLACTKDDLMSNPKLAEVLQSFGVEPPMKRSPSNPENMTYAFSKTDEEFKALLEHENPDVQAIVAARLGVKSTLEETRTQSFLAIASRGTLPVPLGYYNGHTGRAGGEDGINMQNLPRGGALRKSLCAPEGYVFVVGDSSQIEARTVGWLAGEEELVAAFASGSDIYSLFASDIYGYEVIKGEHKDERQVGKVAILGLGYGMSAAKFQLTVKNMAGIDIDMATAERTVDIYRAKYKNIKALWNDASKAIKHMLRGNTYDIGVPLELHCESDTNEGAVIEGRVALPNGMYLRYPMLRESEREVLYSVRKGKAMVPKRLYGAKMVENCLAEGTLVLTDSGWKPIELVGTADKVHDGVEFVTHGGSVSKSVQPCVNLDGVYMTADHEVLDENGVWQEASQFPRPYRPEIRRDDRLAAFTHQREEVALAVPVRLREGDSPVRGECYERSDSRRDPQLRLHDQTAYSQKAHHPRHEQTPGVRRLAQYGGPLSVAIAQGLEKLWWAWGNGMRTLAGFVRELLGGYGGLVPAWAGVGSDRQRWAVRPGELPMGEPAHKQHESTGDDPQRGRTGNSESVGYFSVYSVLPSEARMAGGGVTYAPKPVKPVYDILDCGPRHRFVVLGDNGPFVVHNCVQALARIVVFNQMLAISQRYKVVLTVHDEVCILAPEEEVGEAKAFMTDIMSRPPAWATGLPVACEVEAGKRYGEAK